MRPWLSVIMPVHGGADLIGATLASAASECPIGVEFLVYNSGEDGGAARRVVERFGDVLAISWKETPEHKPWTAKTNLGVSEAQAPYVATLHQDDLWLPGHLAAIRRAMDSYPDAVLSVAASVFVGPDGRKQGNWRLPFRPGCWLGQDFSAGLLVQNNVAIPSPVIRRDAYLACGGMDDSLWYTADWDLYLKLAEAGKVIVREEVTTAFRVHRNSLTMTGSRDIADFRRQIESVLERHLPEELNSNIECLSRASADLNCALAAASTGRSSDLMKAIITILKLGPSGVIQFLKKSRILDRLRPRMRLMISGGN